MLFGSLSIERRIRIFTVGFAASIGLYVLTAIIVEPLRGFAAEDSETTVVQLTVAAAIGLACDANDDGSRGSGETLSLGNLTYSGDTGVYDDGRAVKCRVVTNNTAGYTFGWRVMTGSGGSNTGHMISQFEDVIEAFGTGSSANYTKAWSVVASESRWGGRVSSTSSGVNVGAMDWGTDGVSEKWARVKTGSTLTIRSSDAESQSGSGDLIKVGFRAEIGATKVQPTGTYQATVTFTAATQ